MLKLKDNFFIDADETNVVLCEKVTFVAEKDSTHQVKGNTYTRIDTLGYYSTIANALNAYLEIMIQRKISTVDLSLDEMIEYLNSIKQSVLSLTKLK
jgi:hypothetical protein